MRIGRSTCAGRAGTLFDRLDESLPTARARQMSIRMSTHMSIRMMTGGADIMTTVALYRLYLGIADGTPVPAQWTCRRRCRDAADIEPRVRMMTGVADTHDLGLPCHRTQRLHARARGCV